MAMEAQASERALGAPEIGYIGNWKSKTGLIKVIIALCFVFVLTDLIYKLMQNISPLIKSKCIIYQFLPSKAFLLFEYFVELPIVVFVSIFVAALLEKYFAEYKIFFPRNPVTAFIYGSMLPLCSCAAIPVVKTMRQKINFRILVTFLIAAPLLNPYIVLISFTVLGLKYCILRIICSFILAVSAGYVLELLCGEDNLKCESLDVCGANICNNSKNHICLRTYSVFRSIIPYLFVGGAIAIGLDLFSSKIIILTGALRDNSIWGALILILVGVPFYFCNGTDVLLLKPLLCSGLFLGTGMAFSLTSTAICITSIFMLLKFIGKKSTLFLIGHIAVVSFLLSQILNLVA